MSWLCSCGLLNNGLNKQCAAVLTPSTILTHLSTHDDKRSTEHQQVSSNTLDKLRVIMAEMTDNEKLFAQYYNKAAILVMDMDDTQLREFREKVREIATEAKAHLMKADDEIRERGAKKKLKDKSWLVSVETNLATTDAINVVKTRKERMSKMDKLRQQLVSAGIDDATVKEMVSNLEKRATEKNLKTVTFNKVETATAVVQVESSEPKPLFDPTSLNFGK